MVAKPHAPWKHVDWSRHQRWVPVDGRPANVIDLGEGPPLVFVHGLSGSWQNWLLQLPEFARDHRVIAVDLPGFGASPMPRDDISISGYGRWLDGLFSALDIEGAAVVGNSMGGFIGLETALKFPARVERLVLVSAAGLTTEHLRNEKFLRLLERGENLAQYVTANVLGQAHWLVRRRRGRLVLMWLVARHPEDLDPALVSEQVKGAGKPGFLPALDALTGYPIRDRLADIEAPTLIVWGEKDMLVPLKDAYEFDRVIPDSRLVVYEDTGHVAMLERPEAFNAELRAFLARQPESEGQRVAAAAGQQEAEPAGVEAEE
jgi:pimeloyl-ACP methyl ester carboxylesterase